MALVDTLESAWYGKGRAPWWSAPLAALYGGVSCLRAAFYRHGWLRSERLPVPVVVIGNLSVGGTGKTPLTIAVVEALRRRDREAVTQAFRKHLQRIYATTRELVADAGSRKGSGQEQQ